MLTIIGDCHGKYDKYKEIVNNTKFSIQLGDFGFNYSILDEIDPSCHKIVAGNHDNYDKMENYPHFCGDFGILELNGIEAFFI